MSGRGRGRGALGRGSNQQPIPFHSRGDHAGRLRGNHGQARGGRGRAADVLPRLFQPEYLPEEDTAVTQREDLLLRQSGRDSSISLPRRPTYGSQGQPLLLWTNYFRVDVEDMTVFRYTIDVIKAGKHIPPALARHLIRQLVEVDLKDMGFDAFSDFRSTLISRHDLHENLLFHVTHRSETETEEQGSVQQHEVRLTPTGTLNMAELLDYSTSTSGGLPLSSSQELLQALNIIVGHASRTDPNTATVGRNGRVGLAADQARISLGGGLEALRAFVFSARAATERVLINVQVRNLPFLVATPLMDLVAAFRAANGTLHALDSFLHLVSVEVTHIQRRTKTGQNIPRYKTIHGLAHIGDGRTLPHPPRIGHNGAGAKAVEFWLEDTRSSAPASSKGGKKKGDAIVGGYISVYDFFRKRHNLTISDLSLPVINVATTANPSYLPLQVCLVRAGQVARGKIGPEQTAKIIKFAVRQPSANAESITSIGLSLLRLDRDDMPQCGMRVHPRLLVVPGRRLTAPPVSYAQKTTPVLNARWDLRDKKLLRAASIASWKCIYITTGKPIWSRPEDLAICLSSFASGLRGIGIQCAQAAPPDLLRVDAGNPTAAISQKIHEAAASKPSILLVILPALNNTSIYNAVKYSCDIQEGVLCQCVIDSKFDKKQIQYFVNVGLKINLKLGGANHSISASNFGAIPPKDTMFVGLDVTHPSPGSSSSTPSIAGIVSSIDGLLAQWPAAIRVQEARKEMVTDLSELFQGHLRLWQSKNGTLPLNIIVYRDGVSEGQYQVVLDTELPSIKEAVNRVYPPTDVRRDLPRLSIIIVGKRHHTRFYPIKEEDADRTGNPKNGLVVDRGITNFGNWDFFLQAHSALQGTAKPAHYYVIHDEVLRKLVQTQANAADALEKMTHGLCYLFGRATSAVSICPPAYYADLVCERARCYLSEHFAPSDGTTPSSAISEGSTVSGSKGTITPHAGIKNKMFYI